MSEENLVVVYNKAEERHYRHGDWDVAPNGKSSIPEWLAKKLVDEYPTHIMFAEDTEKAAKLAAEKDAEIERLKAQLEALKAGVQPDPQGSELPEPEPEAEAPKKRGRKPAPVDSSSV